MPLPPRRTIRTWFMSSVYRASATRTWCVSGCDRGTSERALAPRVAASAQSNGTPDELLVLRDAEIGEHRAADVARLVDQVGGAAHPESQRSAHVVHANHELVRIRQQRERQLVLLSEGAMRRRALRAHADDLQADLLDVSVQIADRAGLQGAAAGEV